MLVGCSPKDVAGEQESAAPDSPVADTAETAGDSETVDTQETSESIELPRLCINEILADNRFTLDDPDFGRADWVELFNLGHQAVDLAGYALSDDRSDPFLSVFAEGLTLEPRGHLLLYADGAPWLGADHLGFQLDADGETLTLTAPDGRTVDAVRYEGQSSDWSAAREPDGSTSWDAAAAPTPGEANASSVGEPDRPGGVVEEVPSPGDLSELFYADDELLEVGLEISESGIVALEADPGTYVQAGLILNGRTLSPVGVRCKGENSFLPITQKCSLKVKMDEYLDDGALFGLRELTFNNLSNDTSMMHERVAYRLYREAGVPAARANHAWLTLNGEPYGLFANVETVNRDMLARWYGDPDGALWEVHDVDFTDAYIDEFSFEYGEDDRTDLQGAADALEGSGASAFLALKRHMSLESFLNYWAVSVVIGQFDSYPYSSPGDDCHVFDSPESGVLEWLPHGVDETFYFPDNDVLGVHGAVAERCVEFAPCLALLTDRVWEVQALAERIDLYGYAVDVQEQIEESFPDDPGRPYSSDAVRAEQSAMLDFISGRGQGLTEWLGARP